MRYHYQCDRSPWLRFYESEIDYMSVTDIETMTVTQSEYLKQVTCNRYYLACKYGNDKNLRFLTWHLEVHQILLKAERESDKLLVADGLVLARCALQMEKSIDWLTGGEPGNPGSSDISKWTGVIVTGKVDRAGRIQSGRVTGLHWEHRGIKDRPGKPNRTTEEIFDGIGAEDRTGGLKGELPIKLAELDKLEELRLCDDDLGVHEDVFPRQLKNMRKRLMKKGGWKVGLAVIDGTGKQFIRWKGITEAVTKEGLKAVGNRSFSKCEYLQKVTIGEGVESVGEWAFVNCARLTTVVITGSCKRIEQRAFQMCTRLTSVTLGEGVESVGLGGFALAEYMKEIWLPSTLKYLEELCFKQCKRLETVHWWRGVKHCTDAPELDEDGEYMTLDLRTFPPSCTKCKWKKEAGCTARLHFVRMEPVVRAVLLLCLTTVKEVPADARLGRLNLGAALENFRNSGECWRHILTYI